MFCQMVLCSSVTQHLLRSCHFTSSPPPSCMWVSEWIHDIGFSGEKASKYYYKSEVLQLDLTTWSEVVCQCATTVDMIVVRIRIF